MIDGTNKHNYVRQCSELLHKVRDDFKLLERTEFFLERLFMFRKALLCWQVSGPTSYNARAVNTAQIMPIVVCQHCKYCTTTRLDLDSHRNQA